MYGCVMRRGERRDTFTRCLLQALAWLGVGIRCIVRAPQDACLRRGVKAVGGWNVSPCLVGSRTLMSGLMDGVTDEKMEE